MSPDASHAWPVTARTHEEAAWVGLLQRNIRRHGIAFNTLAAVYEVSGEIIAEPLGEETS